MMKLYSMPASGDSYKVRLLLALPGRIRVLPGYVDL